jgi:uncharacterized NAD-dependent epimerase/dehydratase family protein
MQGFAADRGVKFREHPVPVLRKPYLIFLADVTTASDAKTGFGLRDWCGDDVIGECRLPAGTVSLGLPALRPLEAAAAGAGSLVIGVAVVGGQLPPAWLPPLVEALDHGLDVVSGMHTRLTTFPELVAAAARGGGRLVDVRATDRVLPTGTGIKRPGKRVLTVGTDCALGKKYTALALTRALSAAGANATFRATGQTGIMIAGEGIAIDAVVADFVAGAAELLSPANDPDHWDVIEGQGALFHPAYAGVTLGLIHGSQPDAIVLCHDPSRLTIEDFPHVSIPPLGTAIARYLDAARLTNSHVQCAGIAVNSSSLGEHDWQEYQARVSTELDLPVCDPMRGGVDAIAQRLLQQR